MKTSIIFNFRGIPYLFFLALFAISTQAQDLRKARLVTAADTIIQIRVFRALTTITGYSGDSIIVEVKHGSHISSLVSNGLRKISSDSKKDSVAVSFGAGIDVDATGSNSEVFLKIPKDIAIRVQCFNDDPDDSLKISGINYLAEITGEVDRILVRNSSLPFRLNTKSANIDLVNSFTIDRTTLSSTISTWFSNYSFLTTGKIGISFAKATSLSLTISSLTGIVYSDLEGLRQSAPKQENVPDNILPNTIYRGTLNSGDEKLFIKTTYGNVSLKSADKKSEIIVSLNSQ